MEREIVSNIIQIDFAPGALDPSMFDLDYLLDEKFVNEKKIPLQYERTTKLNSTIKFKNESKDSIAITTHSIRIQSKDLESVKSLYTLAQVKYPNADIIRVEFRKNEHFVEKDLPVRILGDFRSNDKFKLDYTQYVNDPFKMAIYSCTEDTIHVLISGVMQFKADLQDLDYEDLLSRTDFDKTYIDFLKFNKLL